MAKIGIVVDTYTASLSSSTVLPPNDGFMVDADDNLYCTPRGNVNYRDPVTKAIADRPMIIPVKAGVMYPIDLAKIDIASSTTLSQVWIITGRDQ